jgi:hypothetical protein
MKIVGATKDHWSQVGGHVGQARDWLVFDCPPGAPLPEPRRVALTREPLPHHCQDTAPHPLQGVEIMIAASAGLAALTLQKPRFAGVQGSENFPRQRSVT